MSLAVDAEAERLRAGRLVARKRSQDLLFGLLGMAVLFLITLTFNVLGFFLRRKFREAY